MKFGTLGGLVACGIGLKLEASRSAAGVTFLSLPEGNATADVPHVLLSAGVRHNSTDPNWKHNTLQDTADFGEDFVKDDNGRHGNEYQKTFDKMEKKARAQLAAEQKKEADAKAVEDKKVADSKAAQKKIEDERIATELQKKQFQEAKEAQAKAAEESKVAQAKAAEETKVAQAKAAADAANAAEEARKKAVADAKKAEEEAKKAEDDRRHAIENQNQTVQDLEEKLKEAAANATKEAGEAKKQLEVVNNERLEAAQEKAKLEQAQEKVAKEKHTLAEKSAAYDALCAKVKQLEQEKLDMAAKLEAAQTEAAAARGASQNVSSSALDGSIVRAMKEADEAHEAKEKHAKVEKEYNDAKAKLHELTGKDESEEKSSVKITPEERSAAIRRVAPGVLVSMTVMQLLLGAMLLA